MYIVLVPFHDLQDENYIYMPGDTFPRKGYKPEKARITELLTPENALGVPVISETNTKEKKKGH
jgi:hypothetical protein